MTPLGPRRGRGEGVYAECDVIYAKRSRIFLIADGEIGCLRYENRGCECENQSRGRGNI
jgi:hypothetical protein